MTMAQNIIAIDIGNTNTKILINTQALQIITNHEFIEDSFNPSLILPQIIGDVKLGICSVVNSSISAKIVQKLVKIMAIDQPKIFLLQTHEILEQAIPAQSKYLKHIGCDRALKIYYLTKLSKSSNHLCFGCGTAFSIEVVVNGKFIDSGITPGLTLQLKTLSTKFTNLPIITSRKISTILAHEEFYTTQHSIAYGIINSFCSLIQTLYNKWNVTTIIGSGGYANLIGEYLLDKYQLKSQIYANIETQIIQEIIKKGNFNN